MRPSRSVLDLELKSLKKKYKNPVLPPASIDALLNRAPPCWAGLSDDVLEATIEAMRTVASDIRTGRRIREA
jgi:hypothetical protein